MISKCGRYVRWHWAHKRRIICDPWQESETEWHLYWKDAFPIEFQEIVHIDETNGEKHIADIKTTTGSIVEVQHSPLSDEEMRSREEFYGDMIWIVDARHLHGWFSLGMSRDLISCCPIMYAIKWWGPSTLLDKWSTSSVPVYFDITVHHTHHDDEEDALWLLPSDMDVPLQHRVLWRLLDFDVHARVGHIAPVQANLIIEAAIDGTFPPPLQECKEDDAWRFRRDLRRLAGHIDQDGVKIPAMSYKPTSSAEADRPIRPNVPIDDDNLPF